MSVDAKGVLLDLVQGPDGEEWVETRRGWSSETDVCSWEGIKCDPTNAVTEINLQNTALTASIPAKLGGLTSLTHLLLSSNRIFGEIPATVAKLPKLVHVDLSANQLRGPMPVFESEELELVNVNHNDLSGELPANVGDTGGDRLKIFDIKYNRIGGVIPGSVGQLSPNLMEFDLSNNKFDGEIPDTLGNLIHLEGLFLSNNALDGPIPASLTRSNLALSQIFLHGNELSGTLPISFADLPNLKNLFIDDNKLTGVVPPELCALNLNEVFFQGDLMDVRGGDEDFDDDHLPAELQHDNDNVEVDGMTASAPVVKVGDEGGPVRGRRRVQQGSLNRDGCNSIACPSGYRSTGRGKDGVWPCEKCHHDFLNPYIGASRCFVLDQFEIMANFYFETNGQAWVGDYQDWPSKKVPVCDWTGISCNEHNDIISIVLPNSKLAGTIPESLGFLRHLEVLDLSDNALTGEVPSELRFAPIEVLDISGNMLVGFIPPTLCEKSGINRNGESGEFGCDNIACAAGTFSSTGRAGMGEQCTPCSIKGFTFVGSKACGGTATATAASSTSSSGNKGAIIASVALAALGFLALGLFAIFTRRGRRMEAKPYDLDPEMTEFTHPEDEIPTSSYMSKTMPAPSQGDVGGTFPVDNEQLPVSVQVKARNAWNSGKESTKEVWLDVPKIN